MTDFDFDLFVIGAGSGGVRAARMSASHGARVAIAEEYRIGGTCVIRGCVPKKLLVYASRFAGHFEDAAGFGWTIPEKPSFNWKRLIAAKDAEVARLTSIYTRNLERSNVTILQGRAVLTDKNTVALTAPDGQVKKITAKNILVATGSTPFIPDVPGREHAITSNELLGLEALPRKIVIVGGGYIALEFATIFAGLGSQVTVVYRGPRILRGFDQDIQEHLSGELQKHGIEIRVNSEVTHIVKDGSGYCIDLTGGDSLHADHIAYATGRKPYTEGLGLADAGVELSWDGRVVVDEYSRSNVDNIYAVGDVTHHDYNLTPVAIAEAMACADTVFNNNPVMMDHSFIPTAVFTEPEVGTVGISEEEAREKYRKVDIYKSTFRPMLHTLSGREERMMMKLVVCGESDKVLGCHMVGADAGEIIQMAAIPMRMGVKKADFDATMALHPSAAEEFVTMREKWVPE